LKRLILLIGALLLGATQLAHGVDVAGVKVDEETNLGAQKLVLNGAGIRYRFTFQVYACALYLPQKRTSTKDILALPGPKRVSVTMLREISNDDLGDALLSGIRKNSTPEETRRIGLQLVKLGELFGTIPRLKKGDNFTLDYTPGSGTLVSVNGKPVLEPLPDAAFFDALLKIWLGENAVDSGLKPKLLGLPDEPPKTNFR
jgi:hypothetical protein